MDEDEIYRQLEALKDRQDAKLPGIGAESDPLYHELDFRVQYELAIRSTRGPHVKDVHEHVRAPELVRALRDLEPARAERLLQARRMNLPAKIALGDAPLSDDGTLNIRNVHVVDDGSVIVRPCERSVGSRARNTRDEEAWQSFSRPFPRGGHM